MDTYQKALVWKERLMQAESASREGDRHLAEMLYRQALDMSQDLSEQERVNSLVNLADFYAGREDYLRAEPLYRQAVDIYERIFGPDNFLGAMCLQSLGQVLEALGKDAEAKDLRSRVTEILGAL